MSKVQLTPRETQFLQLSAEGLTQEAIATKLGLSKGRVENLARQVKGKLRADTTEIAVRKAQTLGLI